MSLSLTKTKHQKVLIANRGEIAIRIARSAKRIGLKTVAVYSTADRDSEHVRFCDEAYFIGEAEPAKSYLKGETIIEVAKKSGATLIHPGYGFLSERPHFVEACEKAGLTFVGPDAFSMKCMGDKIEARKTVEKSGMPGIPGSKDAVKSPKEALTFAEKVGFPILLKAAAGGGGKGMRRVDSSDEVEAAFDGATREAQGAFGDGSLYVEKYILEPHHVEIQVFGDGKGKAIHLGERECSVQRRHQKVLEESPAPILDGYPKTRAKMCELAVKVCEDISYRGAGTFEFIVDGGGNFYFLEMNTRLQVEHPVTEWVTSVDLVEWQLKLAMGEFTLPSVPAQTGSSIEVRIYAEDPENFLPAPGKIGFIRPPQGACVRWDSAFTEAGEVSVFYDPMIAKLSVWGKTRDEAVGRMRVALDEIRIEPPKTKAGEKVGSLKTNLTFLRRLIRNARVIKGDTTTDLIAGAPDLTREDSASLTAEAALACTIFQLLSQQNTGEAELNVSSTESTSKWLLSSRLQGARKWL